ncbi:MAG: alpha/beta hydrolase [Nanoarchaeota archaeon]|nr:alpha/beta hydrolase [Nanoarchaeota archaeon]
MKKVIVVPGFLEPKKDKGLIKPLFKEFDIIFFNYDNKLNEPLEESSKKLKKFVDSLKLKKNEKVSIVGLSAGGVITDYYLKHFSHKKVDKFISIFSPFKGSFWANIFSRKRKGLNQLKPNSEFLEKLSRKKAKHVKRMSVWCFFDPVVSGFSAKGQNPNHSLFFLHNFRFMQNKFPIVSKVKKFLNQK